MFLLLWRKKLGKCTYRLPAQAQVLLKVYDRFYLHACTYALYRPIHRQYKVKAHSFFFGYRARRPYAWCLRPVCTMLITRMHGA